MALLINGKDLYTKKKKMAGLAHPQYVGITSLPDLFLRPVSRPWCPNSICSRERAPRSTMPFGLGCPVIIFYKEVGNRYEKINSPRN